MSFTISAGAAALIGGGIGALGGIGGALINSNATQSAAQTQAQASQNAQNLQYQEFQQQQANEAPYLKAGQASLGQLQSMAQTTPNFTAQDFQQDPGYQFDLQQGQQAIQRSAAANGGLQSGGTLKALAQYTQGQASNEYQNAYNRYMNNQNTQFSRLQSLSGLGQTATGQSNQAAQNYGNNTANEITGLGNAQAGAQTAQGQIWGSALGGIGSGIGGGLIQGQQLTTMNNYLNALQTNAMGASGNNTYNQSQNLGSFADLVMPNSSGLFNLAQ